MKRKQTQQNSEMVVRTIKAGTTLHISGIPFYLVEPARLSGHSENFKLVFGDCKEQL